MKAQVPLLTRSLEQRTTPAGESSAALRLAAGGLPGLRADGGDAAPHLGCNSIDILVAP